VQRKDTLRWRLLASLVHGLSTGLHTGAVGFIASLLMRCKAVEAV